MIASAAPARRRRKQANASRSDARLRAVLANEIVSRRIEDVRRGARAILEGEVRLEQMLVGISEKVGARSDQVDKRFQRMETRLSRLQVSLAELKSDSLLRESRRRARHNEVLDILRRLEAVEARDIDGGDADG